MATNYPGYSDDEKALLARIAAGDARRVKRDMLAAKRALVREIEAERARKNHEKLS